MSIDWLVALPENGDRYRATDRGLIRRDLPLRGYEELVIGWQLTQKEIKGEKPVEWWVV